MIKTALLSGTCIALMASAAGAEIKVGFIGSLSSDTGLSTLRGAEIAIEELNANGGVMGEQITLVSADTGQDPTEGIRAYEYLAETEEVDFIISGSIDDVSLGWLPRMQEYRIPTLDTWTSYIGIIDMVVEDPESMAPYFMNIASDEALATLYINFGADVLKEKMGWDSVVILAEDTAFGEAITGLVTEALAPVAGIEVKDIITYDVATVDFAPIFSRAQDTGADFIYQVSSVNSQVVSSQYVKLQVPMAMTGVNVAALGMEYWEDTGGAGGGISTLSPIPSVGFRLDPASQEFVDTYQAKYDSRPLLPHFNGFNAYHGLKQAMAAAEEAGGFDNVEGWADAMKKQDLVLELDGQLWLRYAFWGDDEVEPVTGRTYPHNIRFDLSEPFDDAAPSMVVVQWYEDGTAAVVYPEKYATGEFTLPSWVKQ
ncbi:MULTISPECIES: ABC transporter substrate-binding protein [Ruegeria]|uniref:ABC transporter substrate-binding protein n=1 Tax=Ruegeria atlantica TaxID=81569 RepID=A0ABX1W9L0_9RHOB|nr:MULTISPECIES: ABC transporter substrate-binding protein [Ruegeria]NOC92946.1 ABC transporter substrate-binding protein [Ruegeria sp. HKCCD6604]NOD29992.1 ABC transporter substrate-binding protein [Ruegeria atlantica]NOD83920.1 ABC transporter substrate-binding protein [Ruegeria sp. HKCCD6119]NOE26439.1 ABC transporter substrate-binding protein [Ruegeria sp. HKCCD6157]